MNKEYSLRNIEYIPKIKDSGSEKAVLDDTAKLLYSIKKGIDKINTTKRDILLTNTPSLSFLLLVSSMKQKEHQITLITELTK